MSKNLYLDPTTKDLAITDNFNLRFTETVSEFVSQKIENTLKTVLREWYLNLDLGLPYFGQYDDDGNLIRESGIFVKNPDVDFVNSLFVDAVINLEEVEEILAFEVEFDTASRQYTVTLNVKASEEIINNIQVVI